MPQVKRSIRVDEGNDLNIVNSRFANVRDDNYNAKLNIILREYFAPSQNMAAPEVQIRTSLAIPPMISRTQPAPIKDEPMQITAMDKRTSNAFLEKTFKQFYAVYPRKMSPAQAKKTWMKIRPNEETIRLIAENLKNRTDYKKRKKEHIPYPSSYLNQQGWLDDSEEAPKYVESEDFAQKMRDKYGDK